MVGVLAHRDLDGKLWRVASAARIGTRGQSEWSRRRPHTAVTATAIFLTPMADEHELPLDHGDLVGVLRLASQLGQRPAALRTRPLCLGQRVPLLDERQCRLRLRAVAGRRRWRRP